MITRRPNVVTDFMLLSKHIGITIQIVANNSDQVSTFFKVDDYNVCSGCMGYCNNVIKLGKCV